MSDVADIAILFDFAYGRPEYAVEIARRLIDEAIELAPPEYPPHPPHDIARIAAQFIARGDAPSIKFQYYKLSFKNQIHDATRAAIDLFKAASMPPNEYHHVLMRSLFGVVDFDTAMRQLMPDVRTKGARRRRFLDFLIEMRGVDNRSEDSKQRVILEQSQWVSEMEREGIPQRVFDATQKEFNRWWDNKKREQAAVKGRKGFDARKKLKRTV